jgi:hypothetical protein
MHLFSSWLYTSRLRFVFYPVLLGLNVSPCLGILGDASYLIFLSNDAFLLIAEYIFFPSIGLFNNGDYDLNLGSYCYVLVAISS